MAFVYFPFYFFWKRKWLPLLLSWVVGLSIGFPVEAAYRGSMMEIEFLDYGDVRMTPIDPCGKANNDYATTVSFLAVKEKDITTGNVLQMVYLNSSQYTFSYNTTNPDYQTFSLQITTLSTANILQNLTASLVFTAQDTSLVFASQFSYIVPAGSLQWLIDIDWGFVSSNSMVVMDVNVLPSRAFDYLRRVSKSQNNPNVTTTLYGNAFMQVPLNTLDAACPDSSTVRSVTLDLQSLTTVGITYPYFSSSLVYGLNAAVALTTYGKSRVDCSSSDDDDDSKFYSSIFVSIFVGVVFIGLVAFGVGVSIFLVKKDNWDVYTGVDGGKSQSSNGDEDEDEEGGERGSGDDEGSGEGVEEDGSVKKFGGNGGVEYDRGNASDASDATSKNSFDGSAEVLVRSLDGSGGGGDRSGHLSYEDFFRMHVTALQGSNDFTAGAIELQNFGLPQQQPTSARDKKKKKKKKSESEDSTDSDDDNDSDEEQAEKKKTRKGKEKAKNKGDIEVGAV